MLSGVLLSKCMEKIYSNFVGSLSCVDSFVRLTLAERRRFHTVVQVFKSVCRLCPVYLDDFFVNSVALTGHCGRNPYRVFIPRVRTSFGYYCGAVIWNQLNSKLYEASDLWYKPPTT